MRLGRVPRKQHNARPRAAMPGVDPSSMPAELRAGRHHYGSKIPGPLLISCFPTSELAPPGQQPRDSRSEAVRPGRERGEELPIAARNLVLYRCGLQLSRPGVTGCLGLHERDSFSPMHSGLPSLFQQVFPATWRCVSATWPSRPFLSLLQSGRNRHNQ